MEMFNPWTELRTPEDLVNEYIDSKMLAKENPLSFGMPTIDDELNGELRTKTAAIIGYSGTKKSLFAFNVAMNSSIKHRSRGIYSTMEMSYDAMLERIIDYAVEVGDKNINASRHIREQISRDTMYLLAKRLQDGLKESYGNYLLLNQKNGHTYKTYKTLITEAKNRYEKVDMLVVDGLSMMGGAGSEREKMDEHTMMLKELAKEEKMFIPIIVHASKGEDRHTRDLSSKARGSEKIIDNCDMCFSLSLVQDPLDPGRDRNDQGYIRLWNKRGSGNVVNVIYNFDSIRLNMTESSIDPSSVDQEEERF